MKKPESRLGTTLSSYKEVIAMKLPIQKLSDINFWYLLALFRTTAIVTL